MSRSLEYSLKILDKDLNLKFVEASLDLKTNIGRDVQEFYNIMLEHYIETKDIKMFDIDDIDGIVKYILQVEDCSPLTTRYNGSPESFVSSELPKILNVLKHFSETHTSFPFNYIQEELEFLDLFVALVGLGVGIKTKYNISLKYTTYQYYMYIERCIDKERRALSCVIEAEMILPSCRKDLTRRDIEFCLHLFKDSKNELKKIRNRYVYNLHEWDLAIPIPSNWYYDIKTVKLIKKHLGKDIEVNDSNFADLGKSARDKEDIHQHEMINFELERCIREEKAEEQIKKLERQKFQNATMNCYGESGTTSYSFTRIIDAAEEAMINKYSQYNY